MKARLVGSRFAYPALQIVGCCIVGEQPAAWLLTGWWRPAGEVAGALVLGGVRVWFWHRSQRRRLQAMAAQARFN